MSGPAVTFDYGGWVTRYPEFAGIPQPLAQAYFDEASVYCSNDTCNPAFNITVFSNGTQIPLLARLLAMLTAHVAWLNAPRDGSGNPATTGAPASPLVGTMTNAAEGSVNVAVKLESSGSPSEAFFVQSKYGLAFWQASAQFRTAQYVAHPTRVGVPLFGGRGGFGLT